MRKKNLRLAGNILRNWSSYLWGFPQPFPIGYVIIGVTYFCNAKCRMCNIHDFYLEKPELRTTEMDLPQMLEKLKESRLVKKINHIDLTGGEPFLKPGLADFIRGLFSMPNIDMVTMNTNGMLIDRIAESTEEILRVMTRDKCFSISLSIDGIGKLHDRIRGVTGAFARLEKTIERLKLLRDRYPNFTVRSNTVIQPSNIDFLQQIKDYWRMHGIQGAFALIQDPVYARSPQAACDLKGFQGRDIDKIISATPKPKGTDYYLKDNCRRPLHCFAAYASMFIDPFEDLYSCNFAAGDRRFHIGNIKEAGIDDIWESPEAYKVRAQVKKCTYTSCWSGCEVDQTMVQFEPIERVVRTVSLGFLSYYKLRGLKGFK